MSCTWGGIVPCKSVDWALTGWKAALSKITSGSWWTTAVPELAVCPCSKESPPYTEFSKQKGSQQVGMCEHVWDGLSPVCQCLSLLEQSTVGARCPEVCGLCPHRSSKVGWVRHWTSWSCKTNFELSCETDFDDIRDPSHPMWSYISLLLLPLTSSNLQNCT